MKKQKRFEVILQEPNGLSRGVTILRDTKTGVQYLFYAEGYGGGLTALLDSDGNPVITKKPNPEVNP